MKNGQFAKLRKRNFFESSGRGGEEQATKENTKARSSESNASLVSDSLLSLSLSLSRARACCCNKTTTLPAFRKSFEVLKKQRYVRSVVIRGLKNNAACVQSSLEASKSTLRDFRSSFQIPKTTLLACVQEVIEVPKKQCVRSRKVIRDPKKNATCVQEIIGRPNKQQ